MAQTALARQTAGEPDRLHVVRATQRFKPADQSLICHVHAYMPRAKLLTLLNARLLADQGGAAQRYTPEELDAEIRRQSPDTAVAPRANDWAGLRQMLDQARREGVLERITEQAIQDFALIFRCTPKQLMVLKDTLLSEDA
ncbi:MAG: hypothetical protein K0Q43_198 [Ramlibacter sp.]|jgi:hypothetical protein|nr:hypothetical protein [Ramlibacter sp.]